MQYFLSRIGILMIVMAFGCTTLTAQDDWYQQLDDVSGFDTSPYQDQLDSAAKKLVEAFPQQYQDSFRVYGFGFYLHNEEFEGSYPAVFDGAVQKAESENSFYLLIGKKSNEQGIYTGFTIELKLPENDYFQCYEPENIEFIKNKIAIIAEQKYSQLGNSPYNYAQAEIASMNALISILKKAEQCCIQGRNQNNCTACSNDVKYFRSLMENNGFKGMSVDSLEVIPYTDTSNAFNEYVKLITNIDGEQININEDVGNFINNMASGMEGVSGKLYYYDYTDFNCYNILNTILNENNEAPTFKDKKDNNNDRNSQNEDYIYKVTVIGSTDSLGSSEIHIRSKINYGNESNGKSIYLQKLSGCCLNMNEVRDSLVKFYSYLGSYIYNIGNTELTDTIHSLVPHIEVSEFLPIDDVRDNTIVLFGKGSRLIDMVQGGYYTDIAEDFSDDTKGGVCEFITNEFQLEIGELSYSGNISLVRTDIDEDILSDWRCNTMEELTSFLAFHATGHNAGISHVANGFYNGYMSHGCCITTNYLSTTFDGECQFCDYIGEGVYYDSLQEFVRKTNLKSYEDNKFKDHRKAIYDRYH